MTAHKCRLCSLTQKGRVGNSAQIVRASPLVGLEQPQLGGKCTNTLKCSHSRKGNYSTQSLVGWASASDTICNNRPPDENTDGLSPRRIIEEERTSIPWARLLLPHPTIYGTKDIPTNMRYSMHSPFTAASETR